MQNSRYSARIVGIWDPPVPPYFPPDRIGAIEK